MEQRQVRRSGRKEARKQVRCFRRQGRRVGRQEKKVGRREGRPKGRKQGRKAGGWEERECWKKAGKKGNEGRRQGLKRLDNVYTYRKMIGREGR